MNLRPAAASLLGLVTCAALGGFAACSSSNDDAGATESPDGGASVTPETGPLHDASGAPKEAGVDARTTEWTRPNTYLTGCTSDPGAPKGTVDPNAAADPTGGAASFTLAMALAGFPETPGQLVAIISTEKSIIECALDEVAAPISVANFVGLARGTRPYKDTAGKWKLGRFYDGLVWHRVIPGFVIQGGDPSGDGTGGPGYDLVKENQISEPLGTLAMAASKEVSGSQFYVVVGKGPAAQYNVFGKCTTKNAIAIAAVDRDSDDLPTTPVHMSKIDFARCF